MVRRAGTARAARGAGIGVTMMAASIVSVFWGIVGDGRFLRRRITLGRMLVSRLRIFFPGIAVVLVATVTLAIARIVLPRVACGAIQTRVAVIELGLTLIAELAQRKLLLIFQVAANVSVFTVVLTALRQFVVLAAVQAVDLVVEIGFQFSTRIWQFWVARGKHSGCDQQEGPNYKGITYPLLVHTNGLLGSYHLALGRTNFRVLIYQDWLRRDSAPWSVFREYHVEADSRN